jgi:hypothetical protein
MTSENAKKCTNYPLSQLIADAGFVLGVVLMGAAVLLIWWKTQ